MSVYEALSLCIALSMLILAITEKATKNNHPMASKLEGGYFSLVTPE
ncbi:putative holin-like toxin [Peribacillus frigoritolerans]